MSERRRGLLGHSAIYGAAQLAGAAASVVLLPIYTSRLAPRDFGMVAVLELCMTLLAGLIGASVGSAATRLHFRPEHEHDRHRTWSTGLIAILGQVGLVMALGALARRPFAVALFGTDAGDGAALIGPMLLLALVNVVTSYGFAYLRAEERSTVFLWMTLVGLSLRIGLNLWLLVALRLGVAGYLASGILAGGAQALVLLVLLFRGRPLRFDRGRWRELAAFAGPIAIASLASLSMHQADLWILRILLGDLGEIGIYAFAYSMVQRANALMLMPFSSIWGTRLYQLDRTPERAVAYRRVFRAYTLISGIALTGLALGAEPVVSLMGGERYLPSASLIPVLCAGFFLFSLHGFFVVPALVVGRSTSIAWNATTAAAINVALAVALIPVAGIRGAAIASLVTYGAYSFGGWWRYRRLEDLHFPLDHLAKIAAVAIAARVSLALLPLHASSPWVALVLALAWTLVAATVMLLACGRDLVPAPAEARRVLQALLARRDTGSATAARPAGDA